MADTETTTATVETTVEIPTIDDRKLGTYFLLIDRHGEVDFIGEDRKDAEKVLRTTAKGRSGTGRSPSVFIVEAQGVPTDAALADDATS